MRYGLRQIRQPGHTGYHLDNQFKLSHRKIGPFRILKRVDDLTYETALLFYLEWYPTINIARLLERRWIAD